MSIGIIVNMIYKVKKKEEINTITRITPDFQMFHLVVFQVIDESKKILYNIFNFRK